MAARATRWCRSEDAGLARVQRPQPGRVQLNLTEEELGAAADLVQNYPWMGGKKRAGNLVHDGNAWVGPSSYDHIKQIIASLYGE